MMSEFCLIVGCIILHQTVISVVKLLMRLVFSKLKIGLLSDLNFKAEYVYWTGMMEYSGFPDVNRNAVNFAFFLC